jgi:hypothetical protein
MTYTLRRTWADDPRANQDDYVVRCDGKDVGRMYKTLGVDGSTVWQWTIYGVNKSGREPTLDAAKARWKTAFEERREE